MGNSEFKVEVNRISEMAEQLELFAMAGDWTPQELYLVCRFLAIFYEVANGANFEQELLLRSEFIAMVYESKSYPGGSGETDPAR
jgi:hypothetical protein